MSKYNIIATSERELVIPHLILNYSGTIQIIVCCHFNIIVYICNIVSRGSDLVYIRTATLGRLGSFGAQAD